MTSQSLLESLPLELIRLVASFCTIEENLFKLPQVSKRFHIACHDRELLKTIFQREASYMKTLSSVYQIVEGIDVRSSSGITQYLDEASRSHPDPVNFWSRWTFALRTLASPPLVWKSGDFPSFLRLMEYLPHTLFIGFPLPFTPFERQLLPQLCAFYFLDVSGPPAFRARLFSGHLSQEELNLRMALCLTIFILQRRLSTILFEKTPYMGDQSIASWLGGAIIGSRDYMRLNNRYPSNIKRKAPTDSETIITVMGMAAARLYRHFDDTTFPDPRELPLLQHPIMSIYPVPFDVYDQVLSCETGHTDRNFAEMISAQRKQFLDSDEISTGTWCGYYLFDRPHDIQEFRFSARLRGIKFHSTKITSETWHITSDPFFDTEFAGTLDREGQVNLRRDIGSDMYEHWQGQLSPFGLSGGYYAHHPSGRVIPGGLFWFWKEEWNGSDVNHP